MSRSVMKNSVLRLLPGLLCLALPLSSCSSSKHAKTSATFTVTPAEQRYREATERIASKKYDNAILILESLMFSTRATDLEDDVLNSLADSYFKTKQFVLAADTYRRLLQQTPDSPFAKNAQFQLARAYEKLSPFYELDQEYTLKAINEFTTYLDQYPSDDSAQAASDADMYKKLMEVNPSNASYKQKYEAAMATLSNESPARYSSQAIPLLREKLARNRFSIARQYTKLKKYRAAEIFYDVIVNQYADTKWIESAWIGKIEMEIKRENWFEARQSIEAFRQLFPAKAHLVEEASKKVVAHASNSRDPKSKK
ncbi:MAG: outer membrane protein assembly factor BamD [Chlorobaculum sp.]|jgi:outer membrane protein assembly factor BamD|nr:outer membrane protein assembly factor BamD [Chlorobaculum sp.]